MKFTKLLFVALLVVIVSSAGCVGFWRDAYKSLNPAPVPSATTSPVEASAPVNQTIERQYMYADMLNSGLAAYNNGIIALNQSKDASNRSDWSNASIDVLNAEAYMKQASDAFLGMRQYAATPYEVNLSAKWNDTAYYYIQTFEYANLSYNEQAYQASRVLPNYVKLNYYIQQANFYSALASKSREEAIDLERKTFVGQMDQSQ